MKNSCFFYPALLLLSSCNSEIGKGKETFTYFTFFLLPIFLIVMLFVLKRDKEKKKRRKEGLNSSLFEKWKMVIVPFSMVLITFFLVQFFPNPTYETAEDKVKFGQLLNREHLVLDGFKQAHVEDPTDKIKYFLYCKEYFKLNTINDFDKRMEKDELYRKWNRKATEEVLFKLCVYHYFHHTPNRQAVEELLQFSGIENHPTISLFKADVALRDLDSLSFKQELINEIERGGVKQEAYLRLLDVYAKGHNIDALYEIIQHDKSLEFVPISLAGYVYFKKFDVLGYFKTILHYVFAQVDFFIFLGALIILISYLLYIRELDFFNKENWFFTLFVLFMGIISPFFVFPFSDFLSYKMGIYFEEDSLLDFIIRVGLIEEFVKAFPFLCLLFFTKKLKEPYDYIFYISVSALGFAFTENLIYLYKYGVQIMQIRAMFSAIGHMMMSSIIGYVVAWNRFSNKNYPLAMVLVVAWLIAALVHGLYDFLPGLVHMIFFVACVKVWATMINNTINNSPFSIINKLVVVKKFPFYIALALTTVIVFEYFILGVRIGPELANDAFLGKFYMGVFFIFFFSSTIGKVDYFPGYWKRIGIIKNLSDFILPEPVNNHVFLGKRVDIITNNHYPTLKNLLPLRGTIVGRRVFDGDEQCYLLQIEKNLHSTKFHCEHLFILFEDFDASLEHDKHCKVQVYAISLSQNMSEIVFKKKLTLMGHGAVKLVD